MQTLWRFLVVDPFVVLREVPNHALLTVLAGSIIEADHEPFGFGLLAVTLGGKEFFAFNIATADVVRFFNSDLDAPIGLPR